MKSVTTSRFRQCFEKLPKRLQKTARKSYLLWKENPEHPGVQFKLIIPEEMIYSARVNLGYRALGVKKDDTIIWFWIGSHDEYETLIKGMQ